MHISTLERTELGRQVRQCLMDWKEQAKSMGTPGATEPVNVEQPPAADAVVATQETETAPTPQASVVALEPMPNLPAVVRPSKALAVDSPFKFEGLPVRIETIDGEPWFVLADVAAILGYRMASDAGRVLDDDEKDTHSVRTPGGMQNVTIINEAGMYRLVLRSDKPAAKRFQKWVVSEVLPSIRRTGGYGVRAPRELTRMEILQMAMESETKAIAYQRAAEEADERMTIDKPASVYPHRLFPFKKKGAQPSLNRGSSDENIFRTAPFSYVFAKQRLYNSMFPGY